MNSYIDKEKATGLCAALYVNRKDNHEFDAGARYAAKQLLSLIKDLPDANVIEIEWIERFASSPIGGVTIKDMLEAWKCEQETIRDGKLNG